MLKDQCESDVQMSRKISKIETLVIWHNSQIQLGERGEVNKHATMASWVSFGVSL